MVDVYVDFETYYSKDYSLTRMSPVEYVRDPRFLVLCCGVAVDDKPALVLKDEGLKDWLAAISWDEATLISHNIMFDGEIIRQVFGFSPAKYRCTMMLAQMRCGHIIGSASLENTAQYYGLGGKVSGVLAKLQGKRELTPAGFKLMAHYCKQDLELCRKLDRLLSKCLTEEREVIDLHARMVLDRILRVDPGLLKEALEQIHSENHDLFQQIADWYELESAEQAETALRKNEILAQWIREAGAEPPKKPSPTNPEKEIYDFSKDSLQFNALRSQSEELDLLVEARLRAKSNAVQTRIQRFLDITRDGEEPLPVPLKYFGARTGRSSGTWRMNMQNLRKGTALRDGLIAPPGYRLVIGDSAQIEARMNAWFNGQEDLLDVFARGGDPYLWMAEKVYKRPLTKEENPKERFLGKTMVLGLGYGMGSSKFYLICLGQNLEITPDEADRAVRVYRTANSKIVRGWSVMERKLSRAYRLGQPVEMGLIEFWYDKSKDLGGICLPNGTSIYYPRLQVKEHEFGREIRYYASMTTDEEKPSYLFGGKICENIIQALARIAVYRQALRVKDKWPIVLLVHDEVVLCVPEDKAEEAAKDLNDALGWTPPGFNGLPLEGEVAISERYIKP